MASNPMQRRARNSFLLGVLITLLIAFIIVALLYVFVLKDKLEVTGGTGTVAYVYKLKEGVNVESGKAITSNMVEEVKLSADIVPGDAILAKQGQNGELYSIAFPTDYKAKIALKQGTVLGASMLYMEDTTENSLRLQEFNMITLPSTLYLGEYVDVRIILPTGQDYIILSKKCIQKINGETVGMYLNEEEIETMSCAIIDAYRTKGSNIYLTKYVEPGMQEKASTTYMVDETILREMNKNPNILQDAKAALVNRWNSGDGRQTRENINNSIRVYTDDDEAKTNIEEKVQTQISKAKEQYLAGLESY